MRKHKKSSLRIKNIKIPRELKRKIFEKEDRPFLLIFFITFTLHLFFVYQIETKEIKEINLPVFQDLNPRFARLIYEPPPIEEKKVDPLKTISKGASSLTLEQEEEETESISSSDLPVEEAEQKTEKKNNPAKKNISMDPELRRERVKKKGLLALLVGKGSRNEKNTSALPHIMEDKKVTKNLETVFSKLEGLTTHERPTKDFGSEGTNVSDIPMDIGDIQPEQTPPAETYKLKKNKVMVDDLFKIKGGAVSNPKRSKEIIAGVVQTYVAGLKYIYNKELKTNPGFEGKIIVELTIMADGTIANCIVISSTFNNPEFEGEIVKRIKRWAFPPIDAGDVVVRYPFVFYPVITG